MQTNDYRITVYDWDIAGGFEHNVIAVEKLVNNIWTTQIEFNGLATSASGVKQDIGFGFDGDKIKAYAKIYAGSSFDNDNIKNILQNEASVQMNDSLFSGYSYRTHLTKIG